MAAWRGGGFGEEWIPVSVWLSPLAVGLKLTASFVNRLYLIQNKKFLKKLKSPSLGVKLVGEML